MLSRSSFLLVLLILFHPAFAQNKYSSTSKKAISQFETGLQSYYDREYNKSIASLNDALKTDPGFYEAAFLLADIYVETNNNAGIIETYRKILPLKPDVFPNGWFNFGKALLHECDYAGAKDAFTRFLTFPNLKDPSRREANKGITDCNFALEALKHPVPFNPVDLGDSVNLKASQYWPCLSADEKTLVFTVLVPKNPALPASPGNQQEDLYYSKHTDKGWSGAKSMGYPINSPDNEGAQSLSADGKIMYFTACNRPDGKGLCDIYVSQLTPEGWSIPRNLGFPVNTSFSEKQPSISPDGQTLYFVSNRTGTKGALDIWYAQRNEDGSWQTPVNMGDSINTTGNEQSPFIHQDNRTLYFASDGWPGMGGFDIYKTEMVSPGQWSRAKNLGYPINSCRDEYGLIVSTSGTQAFYSSSRGSNGKMDLFSFDLYKEGRPTPSSYMQGKIYDRITRKPLAASFKLIDITTGIVRSNATSDSYTGEFTVIIPSERDYALNVTCPGYLFYSENFDLSGTFEARHPYLVDIPLSPIKTGEKVILKNIFFETDSWQLKNQSLVEIKKLKELLETNPGLTIEIGGHTDNTGSAEHNQKLSEKRAMTVADYLVKEGIAAGRIKTRGYGASVPVADNNTEEGRSMNRRTEFKVISEK